MNQWLKLDNAAKVFPSVTNKRRTNIFRLSLKMTEEIEPLALQEALNITISRFTTFNVRLKKGLFWYYLEKNPLKPVIKEEDPYICKLWKKRDNNGFLFRLYYFRTRITLEVFHALTDGTGAMEFLKSITYTYLRILGKDIEISNHILTEFEELKEEKQDSFVRNYDPNIKTTRKEAKALHFDSPLFSDNWIGLVSGMVNEDQFKSVCKKYNATFTEFMATCVIYSASRNLSLFEKKHKPLQIFIPVNLRKFFPSKTLRNFSLYIRTSNYLNEELSFEDILEIVKKDFKDELQKDKLQARIVSNVKIEKNFFMRIVPLFIKEIVLRMGYNAFGESANSFSLSNLGKVSLPEGMKKYVEYIEFSNGASYSPSMNMGAVSYNGNLLMTFISAISERGLQKTFFRTLAELGLDITIYTNDLEV